MRVDDDAPSLEASAQVGRLKRRAEFLRVGKGRRWHGTAMTIQAEARLLADDGLARVGFTLTKKVGCAVVRNRARRRLREAVRLASAGLPIRPGHDYVIVGRIDAVRVPFSALGEELARGCAAVHARGKRRDKTGAVLPAPDPKGASPGPAISTNAKAPGRTELERIRPQP